MFREVVVEEALWAIHRIQLPLPIHMQQVAILPIMEVLEDQQMLHMTVMEIFMQLT